MISLCENFLFISLNLWKVFCCRYVPAYSTRLKFQSGTWIVLPPNSSDPMGMLDPIWTESNWNTIGLRIYTVQSVAYDRLVLLGGIAITVLAYLAIVMVRSIIIKAMKQDWLKSFFINSHKGKCRRMVNQLIAFWNTCRYIAIFCVCIFVHFTFIGDWSHCSVYYGVTEFCKRV